MPQLEHINLPTLDKKATSVLLLFIYMGRTPSFSPDSTFDQNLGGAGRGVGFLGILSNAPELFSTAKNTTKNLSDSVKSDSVNSDSVNYAFCQIRICQLCSVK